MCELLGLSSAQPVGLANILRAFARRGGETADNPDGWGVYHRHRDDCGLEKAPEAAAASARFADLARSLRAEVLVAHVRKANPPTALELENTHPFVRNCCGQDWIFAHNGKVDAVHDSDPFRQAGICRPYGATDSEVLFCYLLQEIARVFADQSTADATPWFDALATASRLVAAKGQFNFLLTDGTLLLAHAHDRLHGARLADRDLNAYLVASEPLRVAADWQALGPYQLLVFCRGEILASLATTPDTNGLHGARREPEPANLNRVQSEMLIFE
ncbi:MULTISPECIES: class II glutamine amidotransferase [unclassified Thiocapsa]|uniref:class II glutamine amidotransferase n=1 Tax=unclassified Thiocapsa TaxID=2641286 RepID=UPI0035B25947